MSRVARAQMYEFVQPSTASAAQLPRPATASKVRVDDVDLAYAYSRMVGLQGCLDKTM